MKEKSKKLGTQPPSGLLITGDECIESGYYVPASDAEKGNFISNKQYFKVGDSFPDIRGEWIPILSS